MSVFFSKLKLNNEVFEIPAKAGWFEGKNLRMIHAMRYVPEYKSETQFSFQPQIFAETSNELLANIAGRKFEAETVFESEGNLIKSGCWMESKSNDLKEVGVNKSKTITVKDYPDCDCFFYPANRNPVLSVKYDKPSAGHNPDSTRGVGFPTFQSLNTFAPSDVYFEFDYARLYKDTEGTKIITRIEEVFKQSGAKLTLIVDAFKKISRQILINGKLSANYQIKETLSFVLDFLIRLSGIHKCNLQSSAIVLIENSKSLIPEILTSIFPKIQFITN